MCQWFGRCMCSMISQGNVRLLGCNCIVCQLFLVFYSCQFCLLWCMLWKVCELCSSIWWYSFQVLQVRQISVSGGFSQIGSVVSRIDSSVRVYSVRFVVSRIGEICQWYLNGLIWLDMVQDYLYYLLQVGVFWFVVLYELIEYVLVFVFQQFVEVCLVFGVQVWVNFLYERYQQYIQFQYVVMVVLVELFQFGFICYVWVF